MAGEANTFQGKGGVAPKLEMHVKYTLAVSNGLLIQTVHNLEYKCVAYTMCVGKYIKYVKSSNRCIFPRS